jgi:hypothetical protein
LEATTVNVEEDRKIVPLFGAHRSMNIEVKTVFAGCENRLLEYGAIDQSGEELREKGISVCRAGDELWTNILVFRSFVGPIRLGQGYRGLEAEISNRRLSEGYARKLFGLAS